MKISLPKRLKALFSRGCPHEKMYAQLLEYAHRHRFISLGTHAPRPQALGSAVGRQLQKMAWVKQQIHRGM